MVAYSLAISSMRSKSNEEPSPKKRHTSPPLVDKKGSMSEDDVDKVHLGVGVEVLLVLWRVGYV